MNTLDAVLVAVIVLSTLWGIWRGALRSVLGLASVVVAFVVAKNYAPQVYSQLTIYVDSPAQSSPGNSPLLILVSSYVAVFTGVLVSLMLLSLLLRAIVRQLDLGAFDGAMGFVFGLARGLLFAFIGILMLSALPVKDRPLWKKSLLLPVAGLAMKTALAQPQLREYKKYWRSDRRGAPIARTL